MKPNTGWSITLPPEELKLVVSLQSRLKAKSKVEVIRRGLRLLAETMDRERIREAYRRASLATRETELTTDNCQLRTFAKESNGLA
jgi:Arc/MetJ-type ribon-helix-helix transcriptional regulator